MVNQNNVRDGIIRVGSSIVAGLGLVVGIASLVDQSEKEVYSGNIGGFKVAYSEDIDSFNPARLFGYNRMTVTKGDVTYIFIDDVAENGIEWKNDVALRIESDRLERVVIKKKGVEIRYSIDDAANTTIDGRHVIKVFENANRLYNDIRLMARERLREQYLAEHSFVEDALKIKNDR
jgi:hypothetical protein